MRILPERDLDIKISVLACLTVRLCLPACLFHYRALFPFVACMSKPGCLLSFFSQEGTFRADEVLAAYARADHQLAKLNARYAEVGGSISHKMLNCLVIFFRDGQADLHAWTSCLPGTGA